MDRNTSYLEAYTHMVNKPNRGVCGLSRFLFTVGLVYGIDDIGYKGRYCYHTMAEAKAALLEWDGSGHPPGNWVKHKGRGIEESNPKYDKNE